MNDKEAWWAKGFASGKLAARRMIEEDLPTPRLRKKARQGLLLVAQSGSYANQKRASRTCRLSLETGLG